MVKVYLKRVATKTWLTGAVLLYGICLCAQTAPLPVELLVSRNNLGYQMVVKRNFDPKGRWGVLSVVNYFVPYQLADGTPDLVVPFQLSRNWSSGLGVFIGVTARSRIGLRPLIGGQWQFNHPSWLGITNVGLQTVEELRWQFFGLYEYKPKLSSQFRLYTRAQLLYVNNLKTQSLERSAAQFRVGLKRQALASGLGFNLDHFGATAGPRWTAGWFVRWDFQ